MLLLGLATPAEAQRRGRQNRPQPTAPRPPVTVGVHAGYDDSSNGSVLGGQIRVPLTADGRFEIMPSGNVTFLSGLREYQFNLDGVWVTGGRRGGLYVAGGLAARNTVFDGADEETKVGWGAAVGLKTRGRVGVQIEVREIRVDDRLQPRLLTFGLNLALGGAGPPGGRRGP